MATKKMSTVKQPIAVDNSDNTTDNASTEVKKEAKKFKPTDTVLCKSITAGSLIMVGNKTENVYEWADYNDIQEVEYQDLIYLIRSKSRFVFEPFFIIDDDDILEQNPSIQELYDNIYSDGDLLDIFTLPVHDMISNIEALPLGAKETLKSLASRSISDGSLDSVKKISALDDIFGTKMLMIATDN